MGTAMAGKRGSSAAPIPLEPSVRSGREDGAARARRQDKIRALAVERFAASNTWFWISSTIGSLVLVALLAAAVPTYGWIPLVVLGTPAVLGSFASGVAVDVTERMYASAHLIWLANSVNETRPTAQELSNQGEWTKPSQSVTRTTALASANAVQA